MDLIWSNREDVAEQVTALHKILKQNYDPNEELQVYYKVVQDARNTLESSGMD